MDADGGATLTLGAGLTVQGGEGRFEGDTVVNQGTISANEVGAGDSLRITTTTFTNNGTAQAVNGGELDITATNWTNAVGGMITATDSTLILRGDWDNDGTIAIDNSSLRLEGTFSTEDLGTVTRTNGGTVTLVGQLDNTVGGPLTFNTASGSWNVDGGRIAGGVVQLANGEGLNFLLNGNNELNGVTVNGDIDITAGSGLFRVVNGLTLNAEDGVSPGILRLVGSSATVRFVGDQTFDNATVVFGPGGFEKVVDADGGATLTLGARLTVQGGEGRFEGDTVVNQGTISANEDGETLRITSTNFTNEGTLNVNGGGDMDITVNGSDHTSSGTINIEDMGTLTVLFSGSTPTFTNEAGGVINIHNVSVPGTQLVFTGNGDGINDGTINGAGGIITQNGAGFTNNGTINPGLSPGLLTIEGDLAQGENAEINFELAGTSSGSEHDQLVVTGHLEWNGAFNVALIDSFMPNFGDVFEIAQFASASGELDAIHGLRFGGSGVFDTQFTETGLNLIALEATAANAGTVDADTLIGSTAGEVFTGNDGDDVVIGGGGADHIYGDAGDDRLEIGDTGFARVDGGSGNDTLAFDGNLDFTIIRDDQIQGIEEIDISGVGINTLILDFADVLGLADGINTLADDTQFHGVNTLVVSGNDGDELDIEFGNGGFGDTGENTTVNGHSGYSVYENADGNARLIVDDDIDIV